MYYNSIDKNINNKIAIVAFILSITSLICCGLGIFSGIMGIIFSIIALKISNTTGARRKLSLISLLLSIIGTIINIVLTIILIISLVNVVSNNADKELYIEDNPIEFIPGAVVETEEDDDEEYDEHYINNNWEVTYNTYLVSNESMFIFEDDTNYVWYRTDEESEDCYRGKYTLYKGEDAYDYITKELSEFGVTAEELDEFFERNDGDEDYNIDNLTLLILNIDTLMFNGEEMEVEREIEYYYGFSVESGYIIDTLDLTNMATGNAFPFIPYE